MRKTILLITLISGICFGSIAISQTYEQNYSSAISSSYSKSTIYVFFNNEPCSECANAIDLIEQFYNQNFINKYNLFLINYQNDNEYTFTQRYNLSQPLEVVLSRFDDGFPFGYQKIENLQYMTSDPISMEKYFVERINTFFNP